jgi:ketosteroid isomerase-like protein
MSQENVEVFKRAFDAINRRDAEALLSELDPEVEWHGAILMAMGGKQTMYRGHEGVREWLRDLYETLSEFQADYPEIRDLGDWDSPPRAQTSRGRASRPKTLVPRLVPHALLSHSLGIFDNAKARFPSGLSSSRGGEI